MTLATIAATSFVLGFSGAMMPGPMLTVTISETVRRGPWAGPLLVAGHAALEALLVVLLFFGLGDLVRSPAAFTAVALVGGATLVWMGFGMLRSLPGLTLDWDISGDASRHPVTAGAVVSLANPYFTLWWATVGLTYLFVAHGSGWMGVVVFYLFHILSDLVWYSFVSAAVACGRRFLSDRAYRLMVGSCALFILGFGCYFGYRGMLALAS
ncbi:MAG TPA: LysE family transporter [Desulfuromonadales bacterium]|nr:LysE family transporter [Desulfuromonadales bacterium]